MAITLESLYQETRQHYGLKLHAGKQGLSNIVNWIYVAEDLENIRFLSGNELVISTGLASLQKKDWLYPFIQDLITTKVSGLILNIGKYISLQDITPQILELCKENHFPLFTMPWETRLSDLSQDYCNRIFADRQATFDKVHALKSLLFDSSASQMAWETLQTQGYQAHDSYTIASAHLSSSESLENINLSQLQKYAYYCPSARKNDFVCFEHNKQLLFIWHNTDISIIQKHLHEVLSSRNSILGLRNIHFGVSNQEQDLSVLKQIYHESQSALQMASHTDSNIFFYKDLGCYQLFFSMPDRKLLRQFYRERLGVIEDYDVQHDAQYLNTLEQYLLFDGHVASIADHMICHRNTISYRINKIRELLHADLSKGDVKFQLQLAINIRNFLLMTEK